MVICNFLKISRKRAKCRSLSFFDGTRGYGASFPVHETTSFFFSLASSLFVFLSPSFSLFFLFFIFSFSFSSFFSSFIYFSPSFIFLPHQLIFFFSSHYFLVITNPPFTFKHDCLFASSHNSFAFFLWIPFSISSETSRRILNYLLGLLSYLDLQVLYGRRSWVRPTAILINKCTESRK